MAITTIGTEKDIRLFPEVCVEIPVIVSNTGVVADSEGKKVIKAGTPIGSTINVFENRQTVLNVTNTANATVAAAADGKNALGVIMHDTDVTAGNANASMLIAGYVDLEKVGVAPVADAKTALARILFIKGAK
nr:MAG TPA: Head decoration protein [Caudoviricetes sp.]